MLNQTRLKQSIVLLLTGATVGVLLLNLPMSSQSGQYWGYALTYTFLTILAIPLSVLMSKGEISMVHIVGIVAFLAHDANAFPLSLWALFVGSVAGGAATLLRKQPYLPRRRTIRRSIQSIAVTSARVTLSFYAAAQFYFLIGGEVAIGIGDNRVVGLLVAYSAVYILTYAAIYALEVYVEDQNLLEIIQHDRWQVITILATPVAYAVLTAVIKTTLPLELFVLAILGLILLLTVTFSYSRNQYLLRQQLDEVNALSALGSHLQLSESPDDLMHSIEDQLMHILDSDNVIIVLRTDGTVPLSVLLNVFNGKQQDKLDPADAFLIGRIIETGLPVLIERDVNNYVTLRQGPEHLQNVDSWLGVPMVVRGQVTGAMALCGTEDRLLQEADSRRLRIVASTLASALDNARLYQQQQERVSQLNTLNTISALLSSTLSPQNVLDAITTSAAMLTEADAVAVYLNPDRTGEAAPTIIRSAGLSDAFMETQPDLFLSHRPQPQPESLTLPEQQPLILTDFTDTGDAAVTTKALNQEGIHTLVELPLLVGSMLHGAIVLYYRKRRNFNAESVEFMRTFASEAIQSIKNADLYTRTDEALEKRLIQLSILAAVGQQTNAFIDVQTISDVILTFAVDYTGSQHGMMILRNQQTGTVSIAARYGYEEDASQIEAMANQLMADLSASADRRYLKVREGNALSSTRKTASTSASQLIVPILRDRDILGALLLENDEEATYNNETTSFIMQLLNQAAIAIDNRNLFQTVTRSRDRLQVILDAISEAVILLDEHGRIVLANPAVRLIGLEQEMVTRRSLKDLIEDGSLNMVSAMGFPDEETVAKLLENLTNNPAATYRPHNYVIPGDPSPTFIERHILPLNDIEGRLAGLLLVFYDQTRQVQLDNTREEITRMIVHDLRSPLTAIKTSIYLISTMVPPDIDNRGKLDEIMQRSQQAVHKILRRINSLLDVARLESGEIQLVREHFMLQQLIKAVFAELQAIADDSEVTLRQELPRDELIMFDADRDKVERVILNLVDNALKYTARKTDVIVRLSGGDAPAGYARIDVIDHGPGIPEAYRETLFDRFVQVEGRDIVRRGVGLGLTFCKLVVEAHGGTIQIEDNPDGGSIFSFTLPLAMEVELENSAQ